MWMVKPHLLCRAHLLGEHRECHTLLGCLAKSKSIKGYLDQNLVSPMHLEVRHAELVEEMIKRGYNHNSPLTYQSNINGYIDPVKNLIELCRRCPTCRRNL